MHTEEKTQYLVASLGNAVLVAISGRAGYTTCREFDEFLSKISKSEVCKKLILDMKDCTGIDSTVLGLIAGAAGEFSSKNGEIILQRCSQRIAEVVENIGLSALLTLLPGELVAAETEELFAAGTSAGTVSAASNETMIRELEKVMITRAENAARFKQIVEFMRADLGL